MKITLSLLLTLIQFCVLGQLDYWAPGTISQNKVETVSVFQKVPKTNPEYYNKPEGFMAISVTKFNREGLVIEDVCKHCMVQSHGEPPSADLIRNFFYERKRLKRIEEMGFEKSTSIFYYDTITNRRLIIGLDKNDKRNKVTIEHLDHEKVISSFSIDFDNVLIKPDTVYQIFLAKGTTTYKKNSKTEKEYSYGFGSNIDKERFEVFKNSLDINEIERTFESLDYRHLELRRHLTTIYDNRDNELKLIGEEDGKPIQEYTRDKNGLIKSELIHFPLYTFEHLYRYKFWD